MTQYTYDEYLKNPLTLPMEEAFAIQQELWHEIGSNPEALELYQELLETCIDYAIVRAKWTFMPIEEKLSTDQSRTMKHDTVIVKFNQLSRYLRLQGKPAKWRDQLGYTEDDPLLRKRIGDMAWRL